jgi:hypothetical protein
MEEAARGQLIFLSQQKKNWEHIEPSRHSVEQPALKAAQEEKRR